MIPRQFTVNITAPPTQNAPSWYSALPLGGWSLVPNSNSGTALVPSGQYGSASDLIRAWTGGTVDQTRGELLIAAQGGHAARSGNDVFAFAFRTETPKWYRVIDPTPYSVVSQGTSGTGAYDDGRMSPPHGYNRILFDHTSDRLVIAPAEYVFVYPPPGTLAAREIWAFNRAYAGLPQNENQSPLAYDGGTGIGTAGPWSIIGRNVSYTTYQSPALTGPSAIDEIGRNVYIFPQYQYSVQRMSLDTVGDTVGVIGESSLGGSLQYAWAVVATDPSGQDRWRRLVWGVTDYYGPSQKIMSYDIKNGGTTQMTVNNPIVNQLWRGAVYHNGAIYAYCTARDAGIVRKLTLPLDGSGNYIGGAWTWSNLSNITGTVPTTDGTPGTVFNGTYGKFGLIRDMGNGAACLVVCNDMRTAPYIYPL